MLSNTLVPLSQKKKKYTHTTLRACLVHYNKYYNLLVISEQGRRMIKLICGMGILGNTI